MFALVQCFPSLYPFLSKERRIYQSPSIKGEFFPAPQWEFLQQELRGRDLVCDREVEFLSFRPRIAIAIDMFLVETVQIKPLQIARFFKLLGDACKEIVWNEKNLAPSLIDEYAMFCNARCSNLCPKFCCLQMGSQEEGGGALVNIR